MNPEATFNFGRPNPEATYSFNKWLMADQTHRDDPVGDLARDAFHDPEWPTTEVAQMQRLSEMGACQGAHDALEQAWQEYRDVLYA